jgi:hypothetical protein
MSDYSVVFVGGVGRSGSTLLERLLGESDGVVALGEVVHLWRRGLVDGVACDCGEPFRDCAFWREVGRRAFGGWGAVRARGVLELKDAVDRTRHLPELLCGRPPLGRRRDLLRYTELYRRLYAAAAAVTGARTVVDSSKHASLAACLYWRLGAGMRVLHVVRDPRAVAHSWCKRVPRSAAGPTSLEQEMARRAASATAVHWVVQNAALTALARRGLATRVVRYEEFVRAPQEGFARAAAFCGASGRPPFTAGGAALLGASHALSGNPMRSERGAVVVRADESWHRGLSDRDRVVVSAVTALSKWRYGYS